MIQYRKHITIIEKGLVYQQIQNLLIGTVVLYCLKQIHQQYIFMMRKIKHGERGNA